jgi:hypothetical protein
MACRLSTKQVPGQSLDGTGLTFSPAADRDFLAIRHFLRALRSVKECPNPANEPDRWLGRVESALELLEVAGSHLFAGMC